MLVLHEVLEQAFLFEVMLHLKLNFGLPHQKQCLFQGQNNYLLLSLELFQVLPLMVGTVNLWTPQHKTINLSKTQERISPESHIKNTVLNLVLWFLPLIGNLKYSDRNVNKLSQLKLHILSFVRLFINFSFIPSLVHSLIQSQNYLFRTI